MHIFPEKERDGHRGWQLSFWEARSQVAHEKLSLDEFLEATDIVADDSDDIYVDLHKTDSTWNLWHKEAGVCSGWKEIDGLEKLQQRQVPNPWRLSPYVDFFSLRKWLHGQRNFRGAANMNYLGPRWEKHCGHPSGCPPERQTLHEVPEDNQ